MSRQIIISPTQNLIHEVVSLLESETNDFSRSIVVFPGKRPAHFVRKALGDRIGGSFIPPRIFSIDSFIDYLATEKLHSYRRPLQDFDAVALLFDIHKGVAERLGGDHFNSVDRFIGLGLKLFAELEELVMADVNLRQIREAIQVVPLGRLQALPKYFEHFYARIDEKNFTTRSLDYRRVAENIDAIDFSQHADIVLAGFYAYTPLERRIITNLLRRDNTTFIVQQGPGLQKQLQSIGAEPASLESHTAERVALTHFYKASDTHGQVFAISQKIKSLIDARQKINERTVIVLPTADALFPVVHQTLPLLPPDEYNIALGYPLQRTPLFGFISSLMNLCTGSRNGKVPATDYTTFVLHPYTKNILFGQRSDVTRVLFHTIETYLAERQPSAFISLDVLEEEGDIFKNVCRGFAASNDEISLPELKSHLRTIHNLTIRKFLHFESLGDFAQKAIEVLQYIHKQSTATRHPMFRPYAEKFVELFDSIGESLLARDRFVEPAAYSMFLRNAIAAAEVPFPGTPLKGLQVLGLLETRNLSFDTVFLLNATDDVIPGARGHDVLLPQLLREKLKLETYRDRERLVEYYFDTLLAGAREVHCFYTESGNNEKSRFLEKLLWEEQKKRKDLDVHDLIQVVRYRVQLSTPKPQAVEKTPAVIEHLEEFEYTATSLDAYLKCPLQFYYGHVLRLSERDEVSEDVDQREVGSFVHMALKAYFDPLVGRRITPEGLDRARFTQVIDKLYEEKYGSDLVGPAYLVKKQVTRQLDAFLAGYQIPMAASDPPTLVALERGISIRTGGYSFTGRIDRIEQRGERHVILDYKTGRDDKYVKIRLGDLESDDATTWRDAIGSFQLPMYMLLYSQSSGVPVDTIVPAYLFLGRNEITPDIEVPISSGEQSAAEVYRQVEPVIFHLIERILAPDVRFEPTDQLEQTCPQCPYRTICGTSWVGS